MGIDIRLNGRVETFSKPSLAEVIKEKGLRPDSLVVELNGKIIKQDEWHKVRLENNDVLELLNFVGGG